MATQLKNAKVKFEGDKLLLIDAPEIDDFIYGRNTLSEEFGENQYEEALSKAPTWGIKNKEEVWKVMYHQGMFANQTHSEQQGRLYDIPASYTYRFEKYDKFGNQCFSESECPCEKFAILIPQEGVKKEKIVTWVSSKDRLPERNNLVICFVTHPFSNWLMSINSWSPATDQNEEWFKSRFTHWMPLPEPPKI